MTKNYYLAYGSNLNVAQMEHRCPSARVAGWAVLNGYRLVYQGSGTGAYLSIEKHKGGHVPVGVWEIDAACERALDCYEGWPEFYAKGLAKVELFSENGDFLRKVVGLIYWLPEVHAYGVPSKFYLETCAQGYEDFGFDQDVLDQALDDTLEELYGEK